MVTLDFGLLVSTVAGDEKGVVVVVGATEALAGELVDSFSSIRISGIQLGEFMLFSLVSRACLTGHLISVSKLKQTVLIWLANLSVAK